jgi:acyl-CoA synthetase (AMP-forming)/AMP-acid ligase II
MYEEPTYQTFVEVALDRARSMPTRTALEFLNPSGESETLTYGGLSRKALAVARTLLEVAEPGDRVLLPSLSSLDFHVAFLGCLYAGMVAVPVPTPRVKRAAPDLGLGRFSAICQDSGARIALLSDSDLNLVKDELPSVAGLEHLQLIAIRAASCNEALDPAGLEITPRTIAFLQYSSGSTSAPKGVMLTHDCIVYNQAYIQRKYQLAPDTTCVSWLPLNHDMGLCLGFFIGMYLGLHTVLMSPFHFISKPERWLLEISRHRRVLSGGPDFAYALCTAKVSEERLQQIDLRGWSVAFNGAEPVQSKTLREFAQRFATTGFDYQAFYPCYGLAEATLFVAGGCPSSPPRVQYFQRAALGLHQARPCPPSHPDALALVGCGNDFDEVPVEIVDPQHLAQLPQGRVGEIWVSIRSAGKAYWNQRKQSRETFGLTLARHPGRDFFRTGDLGFIHEGELYVSGRLKDLIIINGVNYYPQDVERVAVNAHDGFRGLMAAAFTLGPNNNSLALVMEATNKVLRDDKSAIVERVHRAINQQLQLTVDQTLLVKAGTIPRTSSGKVQRSACAALLRDGALPIAFLVQGRRVAYAPSRRAPEERAA